MDTLATPMVERYAEARCEHLGRRTKSHTVESVKTT